MVGAALEDATDRVAYKDQWLLVVLGLVENVVGITPYEYE